MRSRGVLQAVGAGRADDVARRAEMARFGLVRWAIRHSGGHNTTMTIRLLLGLFVVVMGGIGFIHTFHD